MNIEEENNGFGSSLLNENYLSIAESIPHTLESWTSQYGEAHENDDAIFYDPRNYPEFWQKLNEKKT